MNKQSDLQKKLVQIFKKFMEKAVVPQLKKFEGSLSEWNQFSILLFSQNLNYSDLQSFVDSLPTWSITNSDKFPLNSKKVDTDEAFNPNKTFGGEKAKFFPYSISDNDAFLQRRQSQKDESNKNKNIQNNNIIVANLQKLLKSLQQNQLIIDSGKKENGRQAQNITNNTRGVGPSHQAIQNNGSMPNINYSYSTNPSSQNSLSSSGPIPYHQPAYQKKYY